MIPFAFLFEQSQEAKLIADCGKGLIVAASQGLVKLGGYEKEDLLGQAIDQLIPEWAQVRESNKLDQLTSKTALRTCIHQKVGALLSVESHFECLKQDDHCYWVITIYPLTETGADMPETLETAFVAQSVLDNTLDGIITINEEGYITTFNTSAERIFGYTSPEVVGQKVNMLMPGLFRKLHDIGFGAAHRAGHRNGDIPEQLTQFCCFFLR